MARYAIGDLQGCLDELLILLDRIGYVGGRDELWLAGDLVNRGPQSLDVLRWVSQRADRVRIVLGNHDLHLLAVAGGCAAQRSGDTLTPLLDAPDAPRLIDFLAQQPLLQRSADWTMVHAGLAPQWTIDDAEQRSAEVCAELRVPQRRKRLMQQLYGDEPSRWDDRLSALDRLRFIINAMTRLRFLSADGGLALRHKGRPDALDGDFIPWFAAANRRSFPQPIVFGHWSTLGRVHWPEQHVHGLDTGCVWGGGLTALGLDSGRLTTVACPGHQTPGND